MPHEYNSPWDALHPNDQNASMRVTHSNNIYHSMCNSLIIHHASHSLSKWICFFVATLPEEPWGTSLSAVITLWFISFPLSSFATQNDYYHHIGCSVFSQQMSEHSIICCETNQPLGNERRFKQSSGFEISMSPWCENLRIQIKLSTELEINRSAVKILLSGTMPLRACGKHQTKTNKTNIFKMISSLLFFIDDISLQNGKIR